MDVSAKGPTGPNGLEQPLQVSGAMAPTCTFVVPEADVRLPRIADDGHVIGMRAFVPHPNTTSPEAAENVSGELGPTVHAGAATPAVAAGVAKATEATAAPAAIASFLKDLRTVDFSGLDNGRAGTGCQALGTFLPNSRLGDGVRFRT
ncbi:hypothetical protein [Streptomyces sp. HB132]|uniref:hypothetical protein n=1 Tax=Streptomyces sp. HB132 TaxID=767388 RepID=UPI001D4267EC|nr:hypothetical protein [Streptomyces sp. HB132]MBM7442550.1 hypothetical protein [Streptomyces sp. HB132]